jgi:hypothetical protein
MTEQILAGVQVDPMRVSLIVLCVGAVAFLLRVIVALILEWAHGLSHAERGERLSLIPSPARNNLLVLKAEAREAESPRRVARTIGLRA